MAGGRLRGRGFDSRFGTFFFTPFFLFFSYLVCNFFFCLIFSPFFFLHARSATSMLKHFSSSFWVNIIGGSVVLSGKKIGF